MIAPRKVAVVGAGVAGLAATLALRARGVACEVFEASPRAGGLLAPVPFRGVACDRGSHRILDDAWRALPPEARDLAWHRVPRRGVLVLGDRHARYPLALPDLARAVGLRAAAGMARDLLARRLRAPHTDTSDDEGFEAYVVARAGRAAYERFYRPYAEKVWGLAPSDLSRSVARQRLSSSSPARALLGGGAAHFWYPRGGMSALVGALLAACVRAGAVVRFDAPVCDRSSLDADAVIDTSPLGELAGEPSLTHRGLYLVHLAFAPGSLGDADTWYVPDARFWFGRASRPERFSAALRSGGEEVLAVEIPEGRWGESADFVARLDSLTAQLVDAGVVRRDRTPLDARQTFVRGVYPMYRRGWRGRWDVAMARVAATGRVLPAGRQGLFLHCNLDHAMATARDAAAHLSDGGDVAQWAAGCARYLDLRVRD
ncbi:MAG: FAD-dependent oxidoreductase [Polyangiales bacterium]